LPGKDKIFKFRPIGVIHTSFKEKVGVPIQGFLAPEGRGAVEVYPEYEEGLKDIEGFSHIILVYCFHKSKGFDLLAKPFLDDVKRGVFSIRAPRRPNPIGITAVRFVRREKNILHVAGVDMLDGTPLLDIKPYVAEFDRFKDVKKGWTKNKLESPSRTHADERFGE